MSESYYNSDEYKAHREEAADATRKEIYDAASFATGGDPKETQSLYETRAKNLGLISDEPKRPRPHRDYYGERVLSIIDAEDMVASYIKDSISFNPTEKAILPGLISQYYDLKPGDKLTRGEVLDFLEHAPEVLAMWNEARQANNKSNGR